VQLDASGNATITPGDIDNGSTGSNLTYSLDVDTFTCSDVGTPVTVTLTVTDDASMSDTCTATVTVEDVTPPTALCQNFTVTLSAAGTASITPADIDNGSNDACGIASTTLDVSTFSCINVGANTVTLTVTDNSGLSSTCTAVVTVIDNNCAANGDSDGDGVPDTIDLCDNDPGPAILDGCPLEFDDVEYTVFDPTCPGKDGRLEFINFIVPDLDYTLSGIGTAFVNTGTFTGNNNGSVVHEINDIPAGSYWLILTSAGSEIYRSKFIVIDPDPVTLFASVTTIVVLEREIYFDIMPGVAPCQIPDYNKLESITIYNSVGQIIERLPFTDRFSIPGSASGLYLMKVHDIEGNTSNHKILVR